MKSTMDTASLTLFSSLPYDVHVLIADHRCHECPAFYRGLLAANNQTTLQLNTDSANTLYLCRREQKALCSQEEWFAEYGNYSLQIKVTSTGEVVCFHPELLEYIPHDTTEVVPNILIYLVGLLLVMFTVHFLLRSKSSHDEDSLSSLYVDQKINKEIHPQPSLENSNRIQSLDTFRGATVMLMLFVNSGAGGYWYFKHSTWDGLTFADLVHPWFNWIMGMSIALGANMDRQKGKPTRERIRRIIPRTAKMVILGLIVNATTFTPRIHKIPVMGVLQDLAILYAVVTMLEIFLPQRQGTQTAFKFSAKKRLHKRWSLMHEVDLFWDRGVIITMLQIVHLSIVFGVNVPGCGRGYLGPGGLHRGGKFFNCTGGATAFIDRALLGSHMMDYLDFAIIYDTSYRHDSYGPVGLLSQLVQVYLGTMAGHILLRHRRNWTLVIYKWLSLGIAMITISWLLCNNIFEVCVIPVNKQLWSLTFVLLTSGLAFLVNTVIFCVVDVAKVWEGRPFSCLGANSVVCFVGQLLTKTTFPFGWPTKNTHAHLLFLSFWQTSVWVMISILLYHYKLFLRL